MSHPATTDKKFLGTLEEWFRTQQEILVIIRIRCGAGSKSFELFCSFEALSKRINELSAGTCITAMKQPQLPIRGVVDDVLINRCLSEIPDGVEYLMAETVRTVAGRASWYHDSSGMTHAELREDLQGSRGRPVALGVYPPIFEQDDDIIDAVVPDANGIVRAGPY